MNRKELREALHSFIGSREFSVLALSGSWGVGKTHIVGDFLKGVGSQSGFNGIANVSLFGLSNLGELRTRAAQNMVLHKDRKTLLKRYASDAKVALLPANLALSTSQSLVRFLSAGLAGLTVDLAYWFVRDSIVCLDDIERADEALTPSMIMGFIDELRSKGCKVVIVLNREKVRNIEAYSTYWEKVVDADIKLTPTVSENVDLAFGNEDQRSPEVHWVKDVFEAAGACNLRVHKRAAWLVEKLAVPLSGRSDELKKFVITHAALLTWALLDPDAGIPVSVMRSPKFGYLFYAITKGSKEEQPLTEQEHLWVEVSKKLAFSPADFDSYLIEMIQTGWCDPEALKSALSSTDLEFRSHEAKARLRKTFRIYAESFRTDREGYVRAVRQALQEEIDYLSVYEFDGGVSDLVRNGDGAEDLVAAYLIQHGAHLQQVAEAEGRDTYPGDERLAEDIKRREREYRNRRYSIDEVANHFATNDSWNNSQEEYLAGRTPAEFKEWILSEPSDLRLKIRAVLKFQQYIRSEQMPVAASLILALRELAQESEFNAQRIRNAYGIES